MKISDLQQDQIKIGLRVKGLKSGKLGTIVLIEDKRGMPYSHILWDGEDVPFSGFFDNDCECEVVENE